MGTRFCLFLNMICMYSEFANCDILDKNGFYFATSPIVPPNELSLLKVFNPLGKNSLLQGKHRGSDQPHIQLANMKSVSVILFNNSIACKCYNVWSYVPTHISQQTSCCNKLSAKIT